MDISLSLSDSNLSHDISIKNNDIDSSNNLETAIITSILTDTGWWADTATYKHSKINTLLAEKLTEQTVRTAKIYLQNCLKWLIDDKVAASVVVNTFRHNTHTLGFTVDIANELNITKSTKYYLNWESQKLSVG